MPYYSKDRWKDFQSMFPEHTKTILRTVIWAILLLADLVIGAVVALTLGFKPAALIERCIPFFAVMVVVTAGLFWIENTIWKLLLKLFR